jgi:uncharacterized protein YidB (DUF937 family)
MARNAMPSMLALLGLLAVAGYQNRDKIGQMIKDVQNRPAGTGPDGQPQDGLGNILSGIGDLFGINPPAGQQGGVLTKGLGDLMDTFRASGQKETADSWVTMGVPTRPLSPADVEQAVGADNIAELSKRTGLSHAEILERLATTIPDTVDRMTPGGSMPASDDEVKDRLSKPV